MNITFISAGAGSGKTYRLTEILFKALHGGEARASGILATTFTKKAASELRERARGALLQKRAWLLASEIGAARIGTVTTRLMVVKGMIYSMVAMAMTHSMAMAAMIFLMAVMAKTR